MIVWLGGTYGAGKTTTARELTALLPGARVFDTEEVGAVLQGILRDQWPGNFQHWPMWRGLVVETARQVLAYTGGTLVVPQTVLSERYWDEIETGFRAAGIPVRHFVLHADEATLRTRIAGDEAPESATAGPWRLRHLDEYARALEWLRTRATVIDTASLTPAGTAARIARAVAA
ncbi:AAA family ATPase [Streptomyces sp. NRRL F-5630]|uniref:AAA family ATPase n=1 Tax=Streptomyces sp. NRRL F-5630 TaxID=1463864 RepID=UPI003D7127BE